jgi:multiple sugar transport system ATP-binding protein
MAEVVLSKVHKSYGKNATVLESVDLRIPSNQLTVFVGPSGCGKSTLLKVIAGLEDVTSGQVDIGGRDVTYDPPAKRGIAMVFQSYALYPHMTVFENMAFALTIAKASKEVIQEKVGRVAGILQLEHLLERKPRQLSGGQRQRVAIGRALVREPDVFLLDEPLSNLDAALRVDMRIEIAKIRSRLNATMIYVTHDQVEAMTLADNIVVLRAGRVEQVGSPLDIYHKPANRFVAGFLGSPAMNFIDVLVRRPGPKDAEVGLAELEDRFTVRAAAGDLKAGDKVSLGLRPEHLRLEGDGPSLPFVPEVIERLGDHSLVYGKVGTSSCTLRLDPNFSAQPGKSLPLYPDLKHGHVFNETGLNLSV